MKKKNNKKPKKQTWTNHEKNPVLVMPHDHKQHIDCEIHNFQDVVIIIQNFKRRLETNMIFDWHLGFSTTRQHYFLVRDIEKAEAVISRIANLSFCDNIRDLQDITYVTQVLFTYIQHLNDEECKNDNSEIKRVKMSIIFLNEFVHYCIRQ